MSDGADATREEAELEEAERELDPAVERRSRAIGSGLGAGVGLGGAWGILMATLFGGDVLLGVAVGAGGGFVVALISGALVYRELTAD